MSKQEFVHLHVHSDYSLLDGACKIADIVKYAVLFDMPSVALTDHGVLYGAIEFYKLAKQHGIKPIIGCEIYLAPRTRHDREVRLDDFQYHFILLAKNNIGYKNLLKIVTIGHLEGFYYKPRVDREILEKYKDGIIALSSCVKGEIPVLITQKQIKKAEECALYFKEIYGENFYLELQDQNLPEQKEINETLIKFSKTLKIPLVATNDVHYLTKEHAKPHDVLLCIQTNKKVKDNNRLKFGSDEFYFKSQDQMASLFSKNPEALQNTKYISDLCNVEIDFSSLHLPEYKSEKNIPPEDILREKCYEGMKKRFKKITKEIENRLAFELDVIVKKGLASYFLIIWDIVEFAKREKIFVGPGRGSAAGSLVSYCLGITNINPLQYGLLFERFLNPERKVLPDIDIDFADKRRDEIINYIVHKYGKDNVAQIITYGIMKERQALRDAGRALDIPYQEVDRFTKEISSALSSAREKNGAITLQEAKESISEIKRQYNLSEENKLLIDTAISIEGLHRHASTHAAGVVISPRPLVEFLPLQKSEQGNITTQYSMKEIEDIGLLKMDILGLKNLTIIGDTIELLQKKGIEIDIEKINFNDKEIYRMLSRGENVGVFQLESAGMKNLLVKIKPDKFEDLIAILALHRPGPLRSGMIDDYIKGKEGKSKIKYLHPKLEPILKETYGVIVYQEQVMQIAYQLAGMTPSQAEDIRRAMGKKEPQKLAKLKDDFISGCVKNGISKSTAEKIFELMDNFGGYGFNKSHSAAYAAIAYWTAYLKRYYPLEYFISVLKSTKLEEIAIYIEELKRINIKLLPPDINLSDVDFCEEEGGIRVGLYAVKNVGKAAQEIIKARKKFGHFTSIFDFCSKVDGRLVNKKVIESLIKCGAFSSFSQTRATLLSNLDKIMDIASSYQKDRQKGQASLFSSPSISFSDFELKEVEEFPPEILLSYEKEMLGFYFSSHPLKNIEEDIKKHSLQDISEILELPEGQDVKTYGIVGSISKKSDRKGEQMAYFVLEGMEKNIEVIVFSEVFKKAKEYLVKDEIVIVKGKITKKETITKEGDEIDETKIIAYEIIPFSKKNMLNTTKIMHVKIDSEHITPSTLPDIKEVLVQHKGECNVYLHVDEKIIKLSDKFNVSESLELLGKLKSIVGTNNVWFEEEKNNE